MSDEARVQYKFMIPAPLKAALEDLAHKSHRSLSAEIIMRLNESVQTRDMVTDDPDVAEYQRLQRTVEMLGLEAEHSRKRLMDAAHRMEIIKHKLNEKGEPPEGH